MASSQRGLLTTKTRIVVAIVFTSYLFTLALRDVLVHPSSSHLIFDDFFGLSWTWVVVANVAFYVYLCWIAYCSIGGTVERERIFMACFFTDLLTGPLVALEPEWDIVQDYVGSVSMLIALIAAISMLIEKREASASVTTDL